MARFYQGFSKSFNYNKKSRAILNNILKKQVNKSKKISK